ncbi:MAG TPA: hypothetical protein V6D17_04765 [Candidatus Obscuribacterales bacterium]
MRDSPLPSKEFLREHYLAVALDSESRQKVEALADYEEIRGDHVTLAFPNDGDTFAQNWIPGNRLLGDIVEMETIGMYTTPDIQVLLVSIDGSTHRPFDGGLFHVTVSKRTGTPSVSANDVLEGPPAKRLKLTLRGKIAWLDKH